MSLNDLEIARSIPLRPLSEVARVMGLRDEDLEPYGHSKAKVKLDMLADGEETPSGKYIVVTAITPTPLGEGKTVHTVGISQALNPDRQAHLLRDPPALDGAGVRHQGRRRRRRLQPGRAAGGAQPAPDGGLPRGHVGAQPVRGVPRRAPVPRHEKNIDREQITWRRVLDMNDRALREIEVARGGEKNGTPRVTGFDITSASEIMAVLGLATDLHDLRRRLGAMVVGYDTDGKPVTAEDIQAAGAMTAILKDALKPTLMQTLEGTPALVHTGPFANIAHGNSSIVADYVALRRADYVRHRGGLRRRHGRREVLRHQVRASGLKPDAALLVATGAGAISSAIVVDADSSAFLDPAILVEAPAGVPPISGAGRVEFRPAPYASSNDLTIGQTFTVRTGVSPGASVSLFVAPSVTPIPTPWGEWWLAPTSSNSRRRRARCRVSCRSRSTSPRRCCPDRRSASRPSVCRATASSR